MPMGTIITLCMLIGILASLPGVLSGRWSVLPRWLAIPVGALVGVAGAWNTFWHGIRHPGEFWGQAALVSGCIMMLTALYLLRPENLPQWLKSVKPVVVLALVGCFLVYAITIYRL